MMPLMPGRQARFVFVLLLILCLLIVLLYGAELSRRYTWANEVLATVEPQYERIAGLRAIGDELIARRSTSEAVLRRWAYPPDTDLARIGTDLQQRVRRIADEHQVTVNGSQILPARTQGAFSLVSVSATMTGETGALGAFLDRLSEEVPPVFVEKLVVQSGRPARREQVNSQVQFQIQMSAMRLQS